MSAVWLQLQPSQAISILCLFLSLVHLCSVHFLTQDGRGHWQEM